MAQLSSICSRIRIMSVDDSQELSASDIVSDVIEYTHIFEPYDKTASIFCPADLEKDYPINPSSDNISLISFCCKEIIRNPAFLEELCIHVPKSLYPILMTEAMRYDFHQSAAVLIKNWPFRIISMSRVVPDLLIGRCILLESEIKRPRLCKATKGFAYFVDLFFDIVEGKSSSQLRVLDLRGVILGKDMMEYLIRRIMSIVKLRDLPESDECIHHIIADCKLSKSVGNLLNDLLNIYRDSQKFKIRLHINTLVVTSENDAISYEILAKINCEELVSFCLIRIPAMSTLYRASSFRKLSSLVALEISYSSFAEVSSNELPKITDEMLPLQLMPRLRRLSLAYHRKNLARIIPTSILSQLEFLRIMSVGFGNHKRIGEDLKLLTSIPLRLKELNLSGTAVLDSQLDLWRILFQSLVPTLRLLNIGKCLTSDEQFGPIVSFILPLRKLRILLLSHGIYNEIHFTAQTLVEHVPKFGSMPCLTQIELMHTQHNELAKIDNVSGYVRYTVWRKHIKQRLESQKYPPVRVRWINLPTLECSNVTI